MSIGSYVISDTARTLRMNLSDAGAAVNLTGATVQLRWRTPSGVVRWGDATIVNAAQGIVSYAFAEDDLEEFGFHSGEWRITFPLGSQATVPSDEPFIFRVREPL